MLPSIYLYLEVDKYAFVGSIARLRVVVVARNFLAGSVRRVHDAPVDGKAGRVVAGELLSKSTRTARTKQKAYDPWCIGDRELRNTHATHAAGASLAFLRFFTWGAV